MEMRFKDNVFGRYAVSLFSGAMDLSDPRGTTFLGHKENILAYFQYRFANAICEGINSMIQAAKRKARGFNTFKGFASMIYLIAGKLEIAVPHPFKGA